MEMILNVLFGLFIITFIPGNLMIFAFKKHDASIREMFGKGSFIVRDLDKYVEEKRVPQVKLLLTIGACSFMSLVLIMLVAGLSSRL